MHRSSIPSSEPNRAPFYSPDGENDSEKGFRIGLCHLRTVLTFWLSSDYSPLQANVVEWDVDRIDSIPKGSCYTHILSEMYNLLQMLLAVLRSVIIFGAPNNLKKPSGGNVSKFKEFVTLVSEENILLQRSLSPTILRPRTLRLFFLVLFWADWTTWWDPIRMCKFWWDQYFLIFEFFLILWSKGDDSV